MAVHNVLRFPDLSYFCFDSYPRMEYGTSRNWTAACQFGPKAPIVGVCHVYMMRWRVAERAFGPVGHAAQFHRHWPNKGIWAIEGAHEAGRGQRAPRQTLLRLQRGRSGRHSSPRGGHRQNNGHLNGSLNGSPVQEDLEREVSRPGVCAVTKA